MLVFGQEQLDGGRLAGGELLERAGKSLGKPVSRVGVQVLTPPVGSLLLVPSDVPDGVTTAREENSTAGCPG
jgi:hypothetical protein